MYFTNIRPESEIRGSLPVGEEFISGKLLITEDEGLIFVDYTIVAVVHMIYTMGTSH